GVVVIRPCDVLNSGFGETGISFLKSDRRVGIRHTRYTNQNIHNYCCIFEIELQKMLCMHNIYKTTSHQQRMQAQRIKFLQDEIENFPEDPFNYYALAMEYVSTGNPGARDLFEKLFKDFPTYLPTYYQAANYFFNAEE